MKNNIKKGLIPYLAFFLVVMFVLLYMTGTGYKIHDISYEQFLTYVQSEKKEEQIKYIDITSNSSAGLYTITGKLNGYGEKEKFTFTVANSDVVIGKMYDLANEYNFTIKASRDPGSSTLLYFVLNILPFLVFGVVIFVFLSKQMGSANKSMDFGRSRARLDDGNKTVTFKDVAGLDEEKEEVQELIDFLKEPKKFQKMGARIPKGVLLVGPPGTGKTLLARAVAGEANVPFYFISGSDFVELFVGIGASRVRDMFRQAKHNAPCLIFIDEIDAVGRQRGAGLGGGHDEREQTLNQLLTEMDGFGANEGIIIIAATNRPDVLDPALLRPGRFDRQVTVSLPDVREREAILKVHAKNKILGKDVNLKFLAKRTSGFSGADLENLLNEAALLAVRRNKDKITIDEIDEATDRVLLGPAKTTRKITDKEKKLVSLHEAGHAVIGLKNEYAEVVHKITIIPRGMAGGYTMMLPKEEKLSIMTKNELLGRITGLLGGRVSEEHFLHEMSTGASDDFKKATAIARSMVTEYGMSELGPMQYEEREKNVFLGRDYAKSKDFSDQVALEIDRATRKIIDECYEKAKKIVADNEGLIMLLSDALMKYETLNKEQIDYIVDNGTIPSEEVFEETSEESKIKTIDELKQIAKEKKIKNYSKMSKTELEEAIKESGEK